MQTGRYKQQEHATSVLEAGGLTSMPTGLVLPEAMKGNLLQASFPDLWVFSSFTASLSFVCVFPFRKDTVIRGHFISGSVVSHSLGPHGL